MGPNSEPKQITPFTQRSWSQQSSNKRAESVPERGSNSAECALAQRLDCRPREASAFIALVAGGWRAWENSPGMHAVSAMQLLGMHSHPTTPALHLPRSQAAVFVAGRRLHAWLRCRFHGIVGDWCISATASMLHGVQPPPQGIWSNIQKFAVKVSTKNLQEKVADVFRARPTPCGNELQNLHDAHCTVQKQCHRETEAQALCSGLKPLPRVLP